MCSFYPHHLLWVFCFVFSVLIFFLCLHRAVFMASKRTKNDLEKQQQVNNIYVDAKHHCLLRMLQSSRVFFSCVCVSFFIGMTNALQHHPTIIQCSLSSLQYEIHYEYIYGYGEKVVNVLSHTDNDRKTTEEMTLMESQACWCLRENQKIRKHMSSLNETEKNKKKTTEKKKERRIFTVS